jgi:hypothetical protein
MTDAIVILFCEKKKIPKNTGTVYVHRSDIASARRPKAWPAG